MSVLAKRPTITSVGQLLDLLGGISPDRVRLTPVPGTATKRDVIRIPDSRGRHHELIDGTLVEKAMGAPEGFLVLELSHALQSFLDTHDLGFLYAPDALIEILPNQVRSPDLCFVSWKQRPEKTVPTDPISDLIPELVVEILSPSNTARELRRKVGEYLKAGVKIVWVIDPSSRTAVQHSAHGKSVDLSSQGVLSAPSVLPGFRFPLSRLFARLAPARRRKK